MREGVRERLRRPPTRYEVHPMLGVKIASPEKALLDALYLRPARSRLFRALPELELPRTFSDGLP